MKNDAGTLNAIIECCDNLEHTLAQYQVDQDSFKSSHTIQASCAFDVAQIGEHVKHLSKTFVENHPEVEWRGIAGMRDIIAHDYGRINVDVLWHVVTEKVPILKVQCARFLLELN